MKDIILENLTCLTETSTSSLPEFINLNQYRAYILEEEKNNANKNEEDDVNKLVGSLEKGEFDFQIDPGEKDTFLSNIKEWIFNKDKRNITKISRAELLNKYIIFEIPDYGYMSMSTYYRDFVPQVYLDGKKVWQSYTSVLKYYTAKKAYILVMKDNNLKIKTIGSSNNIIIRIIYKNAKEDYSIKAIHYCKKESNVKTIDNLTKKNNYILYSTSFIFDGYLNGNVISDYDYFYKNNNSEIQINPELIESVELTDLNGLRTLYNQKNYFRQTFNIDISSNKPDLNNNTDFEREVNVKLTVKFKPNANIDYDEIYLKSKYNNKKAYYFDNTADIYSYLNNINYEIFNKEGQRVNNANNISETNIYEVVPEYSSKRKIILENSETTLVDTLKEYVPIYRSNLIDGEVLVYEDGLFKGNKRDNISKGSILILYDNNEEENKTDIIQYSNTNSNFKINRDSNNISSKKSLNTTQYKPYTTNRPSTSFILVKPQNNTNTINNPKAYLLCRCFPIPLDYYYLTPDMIYYKLPDYFYAPKNLYNKTKINGEYRTDTGTTNINRFILDALDPIIYFESDEVKGCTFIDIDNTNEDIYEKDNIDNLKKIKSPYLGNTHIINYDKAALNSRNTTTQNT